MAERLRYPDDTPRISRRQFIGGVMAAAAAAYMLPKGVSFNKPPLEVRPFVVGVTEGDLQLFSEDIFENGAENIITVTRGGKVLVQPSGVFFTPGREFSYVHRGGNSFEAIDEAYSKGADIFDIDANDVGGTVYGEHGIIYQAELHLGDPGVRFGFHLPVVVDVNEEELRFGMPNTYEELIAYIASLSTDERPLAVATELKRGEFKLGTLERMSAILQKYNVPAIIQSPDQERLALIGNELASVHDMPE